MSQKKPPTIRDVAAKAGVSVMTVSRVVNKQSWVSPQTRAKVEAAVSALNYAPSAVARALAGGEDRRFALLHRHSITSAYLGELLLGALEEAAQHHFHLLVENCAPDASAQAFADQVAQARVAGVVVPPPLCDWDALMDALAERGIPAVAIAPDDRRDDLTSVGIDDRHAAREMTRHLIDLGHRRIAFIQGNAQHRASARRFEGYRQAMQDHGLPVGDDWVVEGDFSYRSGLDAAERLLALDDRPTAIFACNDDMAAAAITIAHQRQINVPADLTVCGFDDTPLASAIWPTLTTIRQPIRDLSREALSLLSQKLRGGDRAADATHVKLDYQLLRRQSDAVPPLHQRRS